MTRQPLTRKTPLRCHAKLRPVSAKRAKENREYTKKRRMFLEANPLCQICQNTFSSEVHHRFGRIGKMLNDLTGFMAICSYCHRRVHEHPKWARENGFLATKP